MDVSRSIHACLVIDGQMYNTHKYVHRERESYIRTHPKWRRKTRTLAPSRLLFCHSSLKATCILGGAFVFISHGCGRLFGGDWTAVGGGLYARPHRQDHNPLTQSTKIKTPEDQLTSFPSEARSSGAAPTSARSCGPEGASFGAAASLFGIDSINRWLVGSVRVWWMGRGSIRSCRGHLRAAAAEAPGEASGGAHNKGGRPLQQEQEEEGDDAHPQPAKAGGRARHRPCVGIVREWGR